jgi:hypothetical protein
MANQTLQQALQFRDATRTQAKACIVIQGLSGSGKSGLALELGYYLADKDWQKTFATDTENKSLDLYEGLTLNTGAKVLPFKKLDLLASFGYAPTNYLICKENAINAGALVMINDSITHMWQMAGGVLQRVTALEKANKSVNKYTAWGSDEIVEEKNAIYDVMRDSRIHVISTVRVKEKQEMVKDSEGKNKIQSLGEQQIFMPDAKYEPDLVLSMISPGTALGTPPVAEVLKSRYAILEVGQTYSFSESLILQLVDYLKQGTDPAILQEQQRLDYIQAITETLDKDVSKRTMFPILKEQLGEKETPLTGLTLDKVRTLLGMLIN